MRGSRWDDPTTGRQVLLLAIDAPDALAEWPAPPPWTQPELLLLVATHATIEAPQLGGLPLRWLAQGLVYFGAWGPGCVTLEELVDEHVVGDGGDAPPVVVTAAHPGEPVDDALAMLMAYDGDAAGPLRVVLAIGCERQVQRALERRGGEPQAAS
jgi:hypothetical protein